MVLQHGTEGKAHMLPASVESEDAAAQGSASKRAQLHTQINTNCERLFFKDCLEKLLLTPVKKPTQICCSCKEWRCNSTCFCTHAERFGVPGEIWDLLLLVFLPLLTCQQAPVEGIGKLQLHLHTGLTFILWTDVWRIHGPDLQVEGLQCYLNARSGISDHFNLIPSKKRDNNHFHLNQPGVVSVAVVFAAPSYWLLQILASDLQLKEMLLCMLLFWSHFLTRWLINHLHQAQRGLKRSSFNNLTVTMIHSIDNNNSNTEFTLLIGSRLHAFLFFSGSRALKSLFASIFFSMGKSSISEQLEDTESQHSVA